MLQNTHFQNVNNDREDLVKTVRSWGEVNTDALLAPTCQFFAIPGVEGLIGYRQVLGRAIVYGDPVTPIEHRERLVKEFNLHCKNKGIEIVYVMVSQEFMEWARDHLLTGIVEFGMKFKFNPLISPLKNTGHDAVVLRNKVKKALRQGVIIQEYIGEDLLLEDKMKQVSVKWLKGRKGIQVYLAQINLFADRYGKRWFYATLNEDVIGILILNEVQMHRGWLLNNVLVVPQAPTGVSELLVMSALESLEKEGCQHVVVGPVPAQELGMITGFNTILIKIIQWVFRTLKKPLKLNRHEAFWNKFQAQVDSSYLLFEQGRFNLKTLIAILKAFNTGF